jgi:hypothetical protein
MLAASSACVPAVFEYAVFMLGSCRGRSCCEDVRMQKQAPGHRSYVLCAEKVCQQAVLLCMSWYKFRNVQIPILGVAVNKVPVRDLAIATSQLKQR